HFGPGRRDSLRPLCRLSHSIAARYGTGVGLADGGAGSGRPVGWAADLAYEPAARHRTHGRTRLSDHWGAGPAHLSFAIGPGRVPADRADRVHDSRLHGWSQYAAAKQQPRRVPWAHLWRALHVGFADASDRDHFR